MLEAISLSKSFFGVRVLSDFSIVVKEGEVHALLGHNGSGKSTLIKVLSGYYQPDPGSGPISLGGQVMKPGDSASSLAIGIRVVHQGLGLIPSLTVLENLRMGIGTYQTSTGKRIMWREERLRASRELARVGLDQVSPEATVGRLSAVEQTGVAIARALHGSDDDLRCLILDEPTGALPETEVQRLMDIIGQLRDQGVAILYVTHRLDEVRRIAQEVTVLRDGLVVGNGRIENFSQATMIELITGEGSASQIPLDRPEPSPELTAAPAQAEDQDEAATMSPGHGLTLQLVDVSVGSLRNFSLVAYPGEVVGVISLVGAGVSDIPRMMRGDETGTGKIFLNDSLVTIRNPNAGQKLGVRVIPATMPEKIIESMGVRENLTLGLLSRFWRRGHISRTAEVSFANGVVAHLNIRCPNLEAEAKVLSGGNKQKVVMGRALELRPKVLVVDEPTNGVDVAGKRDILALLRDAADSGMTVLVCSSDIDDMVGGCSRVVVIGDGKVRAELKGDEISRGRILTEVHANAS
jgi:ribose transport system ATP-binding protein